VCDDDSVALLTAVSGKSMEVPDNVDSPLCRLNAARLLGNW
jgi:hypothetical protein